MGLLESSSSGDRVAALRDLRDLLSVTIVNAESSRDVAALSRQLTDVLSQIESAEKANPERKGTVLDELAKRRDARGAGAKDRARSAR